MSGALSNCDGNQINSVGHLISQHDFSMNLRTSIPEGRCGLSMDHESASFMGFKIRIIVCRALIRSVLLSCLERNFFPFFFFYKKHILYNNLFTYRILICISAFISHTPPAMKNTGVA